MYAAGKVFIPFIHFMFQRIDTYIQLKANQQYQRIEINKQHQYQYGADGTIQFIVIGKIAYPIGEPCGKYDHHKSGNDRAGIDKLPAFMNCGGIAVNI